MVRAPARHVGSRGGRRQQGTNGEIRTGYRSDYRASRDAGSGHIHAHPETARRGGNDLRAGSTRSTITHVLYQRLVDTQKTLYPRISGRRAGGEVEATGVQIKGPREIVAARELQHARPRLGDGRGIRQDTGDIQRDNGRPRREGHAVKEVRVDPDGCGRATEVNLTAELGHRAVKATAGDDDWVRTGRQGQSARGITDERGAGAAIIIEDEFGERVVTEEGQSSGTVDGDDVRRVDLTRVIQHRDGRVRDRQATGGDYDRAVSTIEHRTMRRASRIPTLEDRPTGIGIGRGHGHAAVVIIESRDETDGGVCRIIDDSRVQRQSVGVGVDVEILGADRTANRTSREAAITNRRIRRCHDDTATDDVQGVGTTGKVDSVRTTEPEGVDSLAARRDGLRRTEGDILGSRGACQRSTVIVGRETRRAELTQTTTRDVTEEFTAIDVRPTTDDIIDEARIGLPGGDNDTVCVIAQTPRRAAGNEHRIRRGAYEVGQRQDRGVTDRRETAGGRRIGRDIRNTARQGRDAQGFGALRSHAAIEREPTGTQRDWGGIIDAVVNRRGGRGIINAEFGLINRDAGSVRQRTTVLKVEDVLSDIGRTRVGLRYLEYLVAAARLLDGEVTGDNATKERTRGIIKDEVRRRSRGVGHHATRVKAGRVVRVR